MTSIANVLLVRPDFPAKTAQEFIAYCKANPGKINYASQGIGTTSHLTAALFESVTGTKLVHVPYKGTAPALNDIIASHVDFIFMELASAIKLHEAGKARILAVATDKRIPNLPDIPTLDEAGVKGFESGTWNAIGAPPKTPAAIVAKLNKAVNEVLHSPQAQDHFAKINLHAAGGTPGRGRGLHQEGNRGLGRRDQGRPRRGALTRPFLPTTPPTRPIINRPPAIKPESIPRKETTMDERTREPVKITAEDINPRYNWGRHLPVLGTMGVDFEERVDYRRLHRYRLGRAQAALESFRPRRAACCSTTTTSATSPRPRSANGRATSFRAGCC